MCHGIAFFSRIDTESIQDDENHGMACAQVEFLSLSAKITPGSSLRQRSGHAFSKRESDSRRANALPPLQRGIKGIFLAKREIKVHQRESIITKSILSNGICSILDRVPRRNFRDTHTTITVRWQSETGRLALHRAQEV